MPIAVVAFVPVIHLGYLDFFKKYPGVLFVIGSDFYPEFPKLERDIRSLPPEQIHQALTALGVAMDVRLLEKGDEKGLQGYEIIMPSDELSQEFATRYLQGVAVTFESIFLRWNKTITLSEFVVPVHRKVTREEFDREIIDSLKDEAQKSSDWWRQIAAAAVRDGTVLLVSHNRHVPTDLSMDVYGDPRSNFDAGEKLEKKLSVDITANELSTVVHAEAGLVARAAKEGVALAGATLYTTTFPCPLCAKLAAEAGIKKVYYQKGYSLLDAERILEAYGIEIILVD